MWPQKPDCVFTTAMVFYMCKNIIWGAILNRNYCSISFNLAEQNIHDVKGKRKVPPSPPKLKKKKKKNDRDWAVVQRKQEGQNCKGSRVWVSSLVIFFSFWMCFEFKKENLLYTIVFVVFFRSTVLFLLSIKSLVFYHWILVWLLIWSNLVSFTYAASPEHSFPNIRKTWFDLTLL